MATELQNIIDREELIQDCNKLVEWKKRNDLLDKIVKIRNKFIDDNVNVNDFDTTLLIYKFTEQIKRDLTNA